MTPDEGKNQSSPNHYHIATAIYASSAEWADFLLIILPSKKNSLVTTSHDKAQYLSD
jgi:hypothetical protein